MSGAMSDDARDVIAELLEVALERIGAGGVDAARLADELDRALAEDTRRVVLDWTPGTVYGDA